MSPNGTEVECYRRNGNNKLNTKPPYSYSQLIIQAISTAANHQLTLRDIYSYITKEYPFYKITDKSWQNSIRYNLSVNKYFVKVPRSRDAHGSKGSLWMVDFVVNSELFQQAFCSRRRNQMSSCKTS